MSNKKWISISEISKEYDIPISTLRDWCSEGTIPARKMGVRNDWHINLFELKKAAEIKVHFEEETGEILDDLEEDYMKDRFQIVDDPGFGGDGIEIARSKRQ